VDRYERRRPEKTPLHRFISRHLETWLAARSLGERPVPTHVEGEFREYLGCGILCFGFARARCTRCGHGFLVAFSCKGRGVCPSCTGRHMAQTAAHLADRVIPPVPVRQWVISVPKRLRGFLADRPAAVTALARIFLAEIERLLDDAVGPPHDGRIRGVSAHSLKIAPASRFIRVWRSDVGHNHWISDGPTPGQRLADTIESIAEPPLTVLSFDALRGAARGRPASP
jgi:hypothetical protein